MSFPCSVHVARRLSSIAVAVLLIAGAAGVAAAKESVVVSLDDPIAMDSPPGAILLVGMTATAPGDDGEPIPVIGTPFYLRLTGSDGSTTRAAAEGTSTDGYYLVRIEVPTGGPREIEVGIHGSNQDGPMDLPVRLSGPTLTLGAIRDGTAQIDPATSPAVPAAPIATTTATAESVADPAATSAAAPASDGTTTLAILLIAMVVVGVVAALAVAGRRLIHRGTAPSATDGARSG